MQRAELSGDSIRFVVDAQTRVRETLCGCVEGNPDGIVRRARTGPLTDLSVDPGMVILNPGDETYERVLRSCFWSEVRETEKPPIEETMRPVIIVVNRRARHKKVRQKLSLVGPEWDTEYLMNRFTCHSFARLP